MIADLLAFVGGLVMAGAGVALALFAFVMNVGPLTACFAFAMGVLTFGLGVAVVRVVVEVLRDRR